MKAPFFGGNNMTKKMLDKIKSFGAWCNGNSGADLHSDETKRLTDIRPTKRQLDFMELEYYNFIHFGINTFYGREWGDGREDISRFNPTDLDTDQWCRVLAATGSKGIIFTAKHHDGFCLFDTKRTDHSVMHSPFGKDILAMLRESCDRYGLKLGVYLSPWDRHESTYGTDAYNDYFVAQLKELCTNYGELFCLWFDGACGEGKNGKKQVYDWERYYSVIRELQPNAAISITGPDVRWIGNEGGRVRKSEWSVVALYSEDSVADASQQSEDGAKELMYRDMKEEDLGSREALKGCRELVFRPAEADVSINMGWFHGANILSPARRGRSARQLSEIYFNSVGGNASMLLNVPPNRKGLIGKSEIKRLRAFTKLITRPFEKEIPPTDVRHLTLEGEMRDIADISLPLSDDVLGVAVDLPKSARVGTVTLKENLELGQRIEEFIILAAKGNEVTLVYEGTVIGHKRIVRFKHKIDADRLIIIPIMSRECPTLSEIKIYA